MTTNVPPPTFGPTGFQAPSESDILAGVLADLQAAFGGNLNPSLSTPQGQLASSEAAVIGNVNDTFIGLSNQFDPAFATGRYQDALARIYFLKRNPALPTVLSISCAGLPGVVIPVNTQITDAVGNTYAATQSGTIAANGTIVIPFANLVAGPIAVPAAVTIFQSIPGWDSVTVISGALGQNADTRSAFETRRQNSVAANSAGSVASIRGAVLNVAGVTDAYVTDNQTNGTATIGGVNLPPNSLYVAVVGGSASAVAQAIWSRKMPGCSYFPGNTTVTVFDQNSGYSPPFPSYNVSFQIPQALPIFFSISIVNSTLVPSNYQQQIQNAIINAFAGGDGGPRAQIGSLLLATRFVPAVTALGPWAQLRSLYVASPNDASASITGSLSAGILTVSAVFSGTIVPGQFLTSGTGVTGSASIVGPGTLILSQLSGPVGGTGTYSVAGTQTTLSGAMTTTTVNGVFQTQVKINQTPQAFAGDISVVTS